MARKWRRSLLERTLLSLTLSATLLLCACGPVPLDQQLAEITTAAVSTATENLPITGISFNNQILLHWKQSSKENIKTLQLLRRRATESRDEAVKVNDIPYFDKHNWYWDSGLPSSSQHYIYRLKAIDEKDNVIAAGESLPIEHLSKFSMSIPSFRLRKPAFNNEVLRDAAGQGVGFEWEDVGTRLYHVAVSNLAGDVTWAALTHQTMVSYGMTSVTQSEINIPEILTRDLVISKSTENKVRNEVEFKGLSPGTYQIKVTAIYTAPELGDLNTAQAVTTRESEAISFTVE